MSRLGSRHGSVHSSIHEDGPGAVVPGGYEKQVAQACASEDVEDAADDAREQEASTAISIAAKSEDARASPAQDPPPADAPAAAEEEQAPAADELEALAVPISAVPAPEEGAQEEALGAAPAE